MSSPIHQVFVLNLPLDKHEFLKNNTHSQEFSMEKVLKYLTESLLLCIFFKDLFQEDSDLTNLCVGREKVYCLKIHKWKTNMRSGTEGFPEIVSNSPTAPLDLIFALSQYASSREKASCKVFYLQTNVTC